MKTRNKLILSAAAMLTISAAAMVTGTVAWFTTVRQSTMEIDNVTVVSTVGNLKVSYIGDGVVTAGQDGDFTVTGASFETTDISGDGLTFYKPLWNQDGVSALRIDDVTDSVNYPGYYAEFQLKIERDNANVDNGFLVYLGSPSELIPADDQEVADVAATEAARVAFLNEDADARIFTWAPESGDAAYSYLKAENGQTAYGVSNFKLETYSGNTFFTGAISNHTAINGGGNGHTGGDSPVIADLTASGGVAIDEVIVTVRVWLEGTDPEATNDAIGGVFSIKLNLYAMSL